MFGTVGVGLLAAGWVAGAMLERGGL
jgi:hypothetical protein